MRIMFGKKSEMREKWIDFSEQYQHKKNKLKILQKNTRDK